jgi:hypothetical protein
MPLGRETAQAMLPAPPPGPRGDTPMMAAQSPFAGYAGTTAASAAAAHTVRCFDRPTSQESTTWV